MFLSSNVSILEEPYTFIASDLQDWRFRQAPQALCRPLFLRGMADILEDEAGPSADKVLVGVYYLSMNLALFMWSIN